MWSLFLNGSLLPCLHKSIAIYPSHLSNQKSSLIILPAASAHPAGVCYSFLNCLILGFAFDVTVGTLFCCVHCTGYFMNHLSNIAVVRTAIDRGGGTHISVNHEACFLSLWCTRKGWMEFSSLKASSERFKDHHSAIYHWQNLIVLVKSSHLHSPISTAESGVQPVSGCPILKVRLWGNDCFLHSPRCGSLEFW